MFKTKLLLSLISFLFIHTSQLIADDIPYLYFGAGIGNFVYAEVDDTRKNPEEANQQDSIVQQSKIQQYFLEWYFVKNFAVGYRYSLITELRSVNQNTTLPSTYQQRWEIYNDILTINEWLLNTENNKVGIFLGGGRTQYLYYEHFNQPSIPSRNYEKTYLSEGRNRVLGAFWDWGGSNFGFRLGMSYLKTYLPNITVRRSKLNTEVLKLDSSGVSSFIKIRWAI